MRILNRNVYVGPSQYARFPVIRLELDLGAFEQWPTAKLGDRFIDGLLAALPGLAEHGCSTASPAVSSGACAKARAPGSGTCSSTWRSNCRTSPARTCPSARPAASTTRPGVYSVVYEYAQREEGIAAGELALKLLDSLLPAQPPATDGTFDWEEERDGFIRYAQRARSGLRPRRWCVRRRNAASRGCASTSSRWQLGHGKIPAAHPGHGDRAHPAHRVWNWPATRRNQQRSRLARPAGAAPGTGAVRRRRLARARRLAGPVVLKPHNGNHGRGITINITGEDEVRAAFEAAREHSRSVIVETYLAGDDHRLLVVNGETRSPAHAAHARPRARRRQVHRGAAGRGGEQRPAPRRRPREGADQAEARPRGRADARTRRLHRRFDSESG